jgi:multidrug resistance efflux pump
MRTAIESWLASHCAAIDGVLIAAVFLRTGDGLQRVAAWPSDSSPYPSLLPAAEAALQRREPVAEGVGTGKRASDLQLIAHPLAMSGVIVGAVVMARPSSRAYAAPAQAALAESAGRFGSVMNGQQPATTATRITDVPPTPTPANDLSADVLAVAHAAFEQKDFRSAATSVLSSLAVRLGCDRASLGFRERGLTRVEAVSDGGRIDSRRGAFPEITAAMDEAIDEAATIVYPQPAGEAPRIVAAHACLARQQGLDGVCSVPLVHGGRVVGAIVLELSRPTPPQAAELQFAEALARTIAPWLVAQRDAAQPLSQRIAAAARQAVDRLAKPGHGRFKLAAVAAAALIAALLLVPSPQEVSAQARLEGTTQRAMAAPGDGFLKQVFVRPGDAVHEGQVLVEFEGEDLRVERQRLVAEMAGQDASVGDAMQRQDMSALAIASAKVDELKAELAALDQRLERAQMKAPFDGIVIEGDLTQALGAPVKRGDLLLKLAPSDGFRAMVEVDDADIADISQGQHGSIVLTAHPDQAWPMTVARITPLASALEGRTVFEVEVALDASAAASERLRPGMRGVARLHVGNRPPAITWTREAIAWVRLAAWRWIG